ncbi:MAG: hypothetical protein AB7H43_00620 [Acidimicrobiia bacterium]
MVVLEEWQVLLSVPAGLGDAEARALAEAVRARLEAWLADETGRLAPSFPGCTVALDGS